MAFIKTSEPLPISSFIEDNKELVCPKCGKKVNAFKLDNSKAVCECSLDEEVDNDQ